MPTKISATGYEAIPNHRYAMLGCDGEFAAGGEMRRPQRLLWLCGGYLSLGLAVIGTVLPLMPTTVFLLIAAWCFGHSSPALQAKLLANPRFGPALRNWQEHGAIGRRAKRAALLGMALGWLLVAVAFRNLLASALAAGCLLPVGLFIVTRPSLPDPP